MSMPTIRTATAADAAAIQALVRAQPRMNPTGLDWPNFVVAESAGRVVGCAQLRPAGLGAVELGSLVVDAAERGRGLAGRLTDAVLARATGRVLVVTAAVHAPHYARWGFRRVGLRAAPARVRLDFLVGQIASVLRLAQGYTPRRMAILERPPVAPPPACP